MKAASSRPKASSPPSSSRAIPLWSRAKRILSGNRLWKWLGC